MQLQPACTRRHQLPQRVGRRGSVVRVDGRERDEDIGVLGGLLDDLAARQRLVTGRGVGVDGEHDGRHVPGAVVAGDLVQGGGAVGVGVKVLRGRGDQLVIQGEAAMRIGLDVHVRVDRGDSGEVDAHFGGSGNCWPTLC